MSGNIRLSVEIQRHHPRLPRFVVLPSAKAARWKLAGTTTVEGTLDDVDLGRRSLKRWDARDGWWIDLPEPICRRAGVDTGDRVTLVLRVASTALPRELSSLIASDPQARAKWERLTESQRRTIREEVGAAKTSATRARRAVRAQRN